MGSNPEKNFGYSKGIGVVLISHFTEMRIVIFRRINCNDEQKVIDCCYFS